MKIVLIAFLVLISLALIGSILMQSGRSAGLSGAITGGAETFFGKKKGLDDLFRRISTILAALFLAVTFFLSFF